MTGSQGQHVCVLFSGAHHVESLLYDEVAAATQDYAPNVHRRSLARTVPSLLPLAATRLAPGPHLFRGTHSITCLTRTQYVPASKTSNRGTTTSCRGGLMSRAK
jgi:hypothetical protein